MNESLVSVCVLTYNASEFIAETLESVRCQSYKNIELIIGDDCSKDNTLDICRKWIENNKDRFFSVSVIAQETNKGVCGNLNACYEKANGKWIKIIAGDDLLLKDCIRDNVEFAERDNNINFVFSRMKHFLGKRYDESKSYMMSEDYTRKYFASDDKKRFFMVVRKNPFFAPTFFHRNGIIQKLGGYDTDYRFEDWSMWVKLAENGYRMDYLDEYTVAYRHHSTSVSGSNIRLFNINLENDLFRFRQNVCFKYYNEREKKLVKLDYKLKCLQHRANLDVYSLLHRFINSIRIRFMMILKFFMLVNKDLM